MSKDKIQLIHPTAIIHPGARIGSGTQIGAYSVIEEHVIIGEHCHVHNHVVICSGTNIGHEVTIYPFCVIGGAPQHLKYQDEPTIVEIKDGVTLREGVTVHRGTMFGRGKTVVYEKAYLMAYSHVAHDCVVGRESVFANVALLAGHVEIGEHVNIGGNSAVVQFCRVGNYCYIGGGSLIRKDLPPFLLGKGNPFKVQGVNVIGLEKQGFSGDIILKIKDAFKIFYLSRLTTQAAIQTLISRGDLIPEVSSLIEFIQSSRVGITR